jgi:hypothetical protein
VGFYEEKVVGVLSWYLVAALLSTISQSTRPVWMAYLRSPFGTEHCRPTFWMFRFAWRGAISTGRRRDNKWVYIAAEVDG